jgi:hypothetical protein
LLVAEVFIGHDGGITALLATAVRFDPYVLHDGRLGLAASAYLDRDVANIGAPAI